MTRTASFCTATVLLFACERAEPKATTTAELSAAAKPDAEPKGADPKPADPKPAASTTKPTPPPADPEAIAKARTLYRARLDEGRRLTKAGQFSEATATYRQALEVDPSDVALLGEHLGPAHDAIIAEARMATTRPTMETAPETLWGGTPGHALPGGEHSLRDLMGL